MGYIDPRRPSGDVSHSSFSAVSVPGSGVWSTIARSGRAGTRSWVDSTYSVPTAGCSNCFCSWPPGSTSRRSHSTANSGLSSRASSTTARNPSSFGRSEQAARNWATTLQATSSQCGERAR